MAEQPQPPQPPPRLYALVDVSSSPFDAAAAPAIHALSTLPSSSQVSSSIPSSLSCALCLSILNDPVRPVHPPARLCAAVDCVMCRACFTRLEREAADKQRTPLCPFKCAASVADYAIVGSVAVDTPDARRVYTRCTNVGCNLWLKWGEHEHHERNACSWRCIECPFCSLKVTLSDYPDHITSSHHRDYDDAIKRDRHMRQERDLALLKAQVAEQRAEKEISKMRAEVASLKAQVALAVASGDRAGLDRRVIEAIATGPSSAEAARELPPPPPPPPPSPLEALPAPPPQVKRRASHTYHLRPRKQQQLALALVPSPRPAADQPSTSGTTAAVARVGLATRRAVAAKSSARVAFEWVGKPSSTYFTNGLQHRSYTAFHRFGESYRLGDVILCLPETQEEEMYVGKITACLELSVPGDSATTRELTIRWFERVPPFLLAGTPTAQMWNRCPEKSRCKLSMYTKLDPNARAVVDALRRDAHVLKKNQLNKNQLFLTSSVGQIPVESIEGRAFVAPSLAAWSAEMRRRGGGGVSDDVFFCTHEVDTMQHPSRLLGHISEEGRWNS
ncbi:BAH domain-containing protein [Pseudoscourfieldia marina]